MKMLVVEDDFASRKLLQKLLAPYGEADVAVDGREALRAVKIAWNEKKPYDIVFLDIMLPELDGQGVLKELRGMEAQRGDVGSDAVKVVMTTALGDSRNVMEAFRAQCEGYLVKPISREKIERQLAELGMAASEG